MGVAGEVSSPRLREKVGQGFGARHTVANTGWVDNDG